MRHTETYYEELRQEKAVRKKEYRDDHKEEHAAYRKLFDEIMASQLNKPKTGKGVGEK